MPLDSSDVSTGALMLKIPPNGLTIKNPGLTMDKPMLDKGRQPLG
jgi:hypothetical protein